MNSGLKLRISLAAMAASLVFAHPLHAELGFGDRCRYYFAKLHGSEFLDVPYVWDLALLRQKIFAANPTARRVDVQLKDLSAIHSVDYDHAVKNLAQRTAKLTPFKSKVLAQGRFSLEEQEAVIPSKNAIRAIRKSDGEIVVFDGNGRVESIRKVFSDHPELPVSWNWIEKWWRRPLVNVFDRLSLSLAAFSQALDAGLQFSR